jgi:U3 small nucleolar RNA-associated protein 14
MCGSLTLHIISGRKAVCPLVSEMAKQKGIPKLRKKVKTHPSRGGDRVDVISRGKSKKTGRRSKEESEDDDDEDQINMVSGDGDDDDSLDDDGSEIGWNSDDEATYGHIFNKKKSGDEDDEEDEDEIEGGMLLSDMLSGPITSQPLPKQSTEVFSGSEEEVEGEDDDNGEAEEDEEDVESDEYAYDEADDDDANHDQLLAAIEKYSKSAHPSTTRSDSKSNSKLFQLSAESPFSTLQSNQTISLDSLLNSLESTNATATATSIDQDTLKMIKSNLKAMASSVNAPKYTHKVQADRTERGVTYQQTSTEMAKWQALVRENKALKSLDLRQDKRALPSTHGMIHSYTPQTSMEKEVQMILVGTSTGKNHSELEIMKSEEDELLQSQELCVEDLKEKQKELSKIKSLLFFEQMKRHRINKIKSKTFHKILKKKKLKKQMTSKEYHQMVQKLKESGEILEEDLEEEDGEGRGGGGKETEEEAIRRIKERMDLRHKNTGRWARMALEHGKGSKSLRLVSSLLFSPLP